VAGFDEDDIFFLTSDQKGNRLPTKVNIIKWISHIKSHAAPEDTFVFFFSGHGMDMGNESYLLTYDSEPSNKDTLDISSLKISEMKRVIEEMPLRKVLLFVDACRNDPRTGKGDTNNTLTVNQAKNLVIRPGKGTGKGDTSSGFSFTFFSCGVGQRSFEWTEKGMGFFAYYLVEGLRGGAASEEAGHNVTIGSLKRYLWEKVPGTVEREKGVRQEPWVKGESSTGADEWVLAKGGSTQHLSGRTPQIKPMVTAPVPTVTVTVEPRPTVTVTATTQPIIPPAPTEPAPQGKSLLDEAQDAFIAGNYADPPGNNAIELARQLLAKEPDNAWARSVERKAHEAYKKLAESKMENKDFPGALTFYERLLTLFPNQQEYHAQLQLLRVTESVIGEWSYCSYFLGFKTPGGGIIRRDGTCMFHWPMDGDKPDEGTWTCTNLKERSFHFIVKSGWWCDVQLSVNGQILEGRSSLGAHIVMTKVQSK
jgi:hypothetical protein